MVETFFPSNSKLVMKFLLKSKYMRKLVLSKTFVEMELYVSGTMLAWYV